MNVTLPIWERQTIFCTIIIIMLFKYLIDLAEYSFNIWFPEDYKHLINQQHTLSKTLRREKLHATFLQHIPPQEGQSQTLQGPFHESSCAINQGIQMSVRDLLCRTTTSTVLSHPGNIGSRILSSNKYTLCCPKTMKSATFQQRKWIKKAHMPILIS